MVVLGVWAGAAQADSKSFERAVPAEPRGVVDISNVSGRIEVIGWDRPEVNVRGELDEGVERVDVTSEHGRTVVKVVLPHAGHHGDAELRVKVPKESEVDVSAVSAEVTTSGVLGEQRLSAVSGDITAEFAGDLEVKTVSGEVKLKGHGQPARLHVSSVSGDVRVGGRLSFTFETDGVPPMEGEVLALEPPRRFIFVWGEDELRFDLEPAEGGEGTVLRFTCVLGQRDKAARDAAGWHVCLDRLGDHLTGAPATAPDAEATSEWREHYADYQARGLPAGAPVPG